MAANYANKADKEVIVCLAGCVGFADTLRQGKFRNKDQAVNEVMLMQAHAQAAINAIVEGLDDSQSEGIMRFANNCELIVMPKSDVRLQKNWVIADKNDIAVIISDAVSNCAFCEKDETEIKDCELRKALLRCGMIASDDSAMKESDSFSCPFKHY